MKYFLAKTIKDFNYVASLFNSDNNKYLLKKKARGEALKRSHEKNLNIKTFIITKKDIKIGWFTITKKNKEGDFGVVIDKPYQGKGHGSNIIKSIEKEARKMGIKKIIGLVFEENKPAIHVYEKVGFKKDGRLLRMTKRI